MKIIAITQARTGSSRLPNKVLKEVNGTALLKIHLDRASKAEKINGVIVATTDDQRDDQLASFVQSWGYAFGRGSENDVLDRFYKIAAPLEPAYVVRITSDCPLIDPLLIDAVIDKAISENADYASNAIIPSFPDGQDVEVFKFGALESAWHNAKIASEREHVTPYIWKNSSMKNGHLFSSSNLMSDTDYSGVRMTVDEENDFLVIRKLIETLGTDKGWKEYADHYLSNPSIFELNSSIERNLGYQNSLKKDI